MLEQTGCQAKYLVSAAWPCYKRSQEDLWCYRAIDKVEKRIWVQRFGTESSKSWHDKALALIRCDEHFRQRSSHLVLQRMAALRGERFHIDLSSDDESAPFKRRVPAQAPATFDLGFVKDIKEKSTSTAAQPPQPPTGVGTNNGFPVHKKRTGVSRFKAARAASQAGNSSADANVAQPPTVPSSNGAESFEARERREIDEENRRRLAEMSEAEIDQERKELMEGMSSSLLQRLLRRANMDEDHQPQDFPGVEGSVVRQTAEPIEAPSRQYKATSSKRVAFAQPEEDGELPEVLDGRDEEASDEDVEDVEDYADRNATSLSALEEESATSDKPPIHFPRPPGEPAPSLDLNSTTFLNDLHSKYFPDLPSDPTKLAWLSDPDPSTQMYSPSNTDLPISGLRFSFKGTLVPPTASAQIPVTKGLHHHGESPSAAGYTVGELAHLARSSFPSQRSMAFQTLGRFLYRLGKGEFSVGQEGDVVERGLWACVRQGRVLDTLKEEADRKGGHMSAKAYAVDALWLWQMGGGKEPIEVGAN